MDNHRVITNSTGIPLSFSYEQSKKVEEPQQKAKVGGPVLHSDIVTRLSISRLFMAVQRGPSPSPSRSQTCTVTTGKHNERGATGDKSPRVCLTQRTACHCRCSAVDVLLSRLCASVVFQKSHCAGQLSTKKKKRGKSRPKKKPSTGLEPQSKPKFTPNPVLHRKKLWGLRWTTTE